MPSKLLICGGRDYADRDRLYAVLDAMHSGKVAEVERVCGLAFACRYESAGLTAPIICIVHGAAPGADTLAEQWARSREVRYRGYPAKWTTEGKGAGPQRNAFMLRCEHLPSKPLGAVVAFPGGAGTADCIAKARAAGVPVLEVDP